MSEANERKISGLLQQGLELYGTGDVAQAFLLWNEVLALDPGNEEAIDYMRDADRRSKPRSGDTGEGAPVTLVDDARRILHSDGKESALEFLTSVPTGEVLETEAMVELLRAGLFRHYWAELGDLTQIPRLADGGGDLRGRNLPPSAGFLLSMVDGETPVSDLVSVSGMDRFEAMRSICRMRDAGILEWEA